MGQRQVIGWRCVECGFKARKPAPACPDCEAEGTLDLAYDLEDVARTLDRASLERREPWLWRYRELLPVDELAELPNLQVGMTPIYGAPRLASWIGVQGLWLKDEGRNPTGTLEDRASALAVTLAREAGRKVVATAPAAGTGASLACFAAAFGLRAVALAARDEAPSAAAARFGAHLARLPESRDRAIALCAAASEKLGWWDRSSASPWNLEAAKTVGHEIAEQLPERLPDWIVVAVGDGFTLAGVHKGLLEMQALKLLRTMPKLLGVQLEGSAPVVRAFATGRPLQPGPDGTGVAASLRIGAPRAWRRAVKAARDTSGALVEVGAAAVLDSMGEVARRTGVAISAQAAVAVAGLRRAVESGTVGREQTALVVVDGAAVQELEAGAVVETPVKDVEELGRAVSGR